MNAADHTGQTAIHWCAVRGAIKVAEILLQEGAWVNAADMYGYQVSILRSSFGSLFGQLTFDDFLMEFYTSIYL